jgi:hypothetical protein
VSGVRRTVSGVRRTVSGVRRPGTRSGIEGDEGQVMLLVLGYTVFALLLVTVVAAATSVHLTRHRLAGLADGAALDAADAIALARFYAAAAAGSGKTQDAPSPDPVPLSDASVRAAVDDHLALAADPLPFPAPTVGPGTGSPDGVTAQVTLTTTARLPILSTLLRPWADGVTVTVTSRARARTATP